MLALAGGKAVNLGELTRAGLPVPPGFCLTTKAYDLAVKAAGAASREALLDAPMPDDVIDSIIAAYRDLGFNVPVAVRSSATAEDLPYASFAGQQDTFLNVVGEPAVVDAVRRCWASLWTERAVVYRATNRIDDATAKLAVVVQRMVDASVAGVMFTANPVTGKRRQAVIDASPGLGEAVVSGAVNPDHFVVDLGAGVEKARIVQRRIGDKKLLIRALPGGGTARVELPEGDDESCLSDDEVLSLAALGDRVEQHYGAPQDTEWAIDASGVLWLTQARPITTLFPLPEPGSSVRGTRVYFCFSVAQGVYRPITPMGMSALRAVATGAAKLFGFRRLTVFAPAGQRLFIDATTAVRSSMGRILIPRILGVMEARSATIMTHLFADERLSVTRRSKLPFLRRVGHVAAKHRVPVTFLHALLRPEVARRRAEAIEPELDPGGIEPRDRLEWVEKTLATQVVPLVPRILPTAGAGFAALGLARRLLRGKATGVELQTVLRGLPHNVTTDMDLELWRVATVIGGDAESARLWREATVDELAVGCRERTLPKPAQDSVEGFLERYGHRAVAEIDLGLPRWSDDPRHILGVISNYLRAQAGGTAPDELFARGAAEAEAMIETLAGRAGWRRRPVRGLLIRARGLAGLRELPKYLLVKVLAACRTQLMVVGQELAAQGIIAAAEDVFFLELAEARAGLAGVEMKALVAQRKLDYEHELRRRHIPRVLLSDGTEPETLLSAVAAEGALTGQPASAGLATAPARVILDPVGARLEPGEILVAPSTDPGWTPLFLTAGGLVMEMGGANSHGAVVAREYGIPAVVGVAGATTSIDTGELVAVDGSGGTVSIVPVVPVVSEGLPD
jgi:pyruvate,water dikinase